MTFGRNQGDEPRRGVWLWEYDQPNQRIWTIPTDRCPTCLGFNVVFDGKVWRECLNLRHSGQWSNFPVDQGDERD